MQPALGGCVGGQRIPVAPGGRAVRPGTVGRRATFSHRHDRFSHQSEFLRRAAVYATDLFSVHFSVRQCLLVSWLLCNAFNHVALFLRTSAWGRLCLPQLPWLCIWLHRPARFVSVDYRYCGKSNHHAKDSSRSCGGIVFIGYFKVTSSPLPPDLRTACSSGRSHLSSFSFICKRLTASRTDGRWVRSMPGPARSTCAAKRRLRSPRPGTPHPFFVPTGGAQGSLPEPVERSSKTSTSSMLRASGGALLGTMVPPTMHLPWMLMVDASSGTRATSGSPTRAKEVNASATTKRSVCDYDDSKKCKSAVSA